MAASGGRPRARAASSAKSTIMMPFFFTMPISRMMPMTAIRSNGRPVSSSASSAPTVADGRHAQHQIHRDHGSQHQPPRVGQRRLERRRRALQAQFDAGRHADVALGRVDGGDGLAQ
ncbi:hypothetical protein G6F65_022972 [Rhizopus arrhizus]|nr:hypothetical protein G6F65_022972 [Rhizopus arrhizus]